MEFKISKIDFHFIIFLRYLSKTERSSQTNQGPKVQSESESDNDILPISLMSLSNF